MHTSFNRMPASRHRQSGAALYVALIILILMTLIGLVAIQVATMQERMSASYQASSLAFQGAESTARKGEHQIESDVNGGTAPRLNVPPPDCGKTAFDPGAYDNADAPYVQRLDLCTPSGAIDVPLDESEKTDQIYEVTAFGKDSKVFSSSQAIVDTVFIP